MKNLYLKHRTLFWYLLGLIALCSLFYFMGRKDEIIKVEYKTKTVYKDSIRSITKTIKEKEKEVKKVVNRGEKLKEAEKGIIYDTVNCKEIVSNLKEQINNKDTIILKKDSIIYLTTKVVEIKDKIIEIKPKPKRIGIGVQVGYGMTGDRLSPYIGVGVSYNFLNL